jgi:chemotaxis protein CheZ
MTRTLSSALRELDPGGELEKTVGIIPDARERLAYVLSMTEQAVSRVLNAVDDISPWQESAQQQARQLLTEWDNVAAQGGDDAFQDTLRRTQGFLQAIDSNAGATKDRLMDIVMAQEFQDLTGQVIKKIVELANDMESQLLSILGSAMPAERCKPAEDSLLNGPAMKSDQHATLSSQDDVDQFLEGLGF